MKSFIFTHMHGRPPAHTHAHMRMHTCTHTHTHTHTELCACDKDTNILRCNFGATLCVRQKSNGRESMANGIYVCWIIIPMHWSCMRLTSHQCSTHTLHPCTLYGLALFIGAMGIFALIIHRLSRHSSFCENSPTFTEMHLVFSKAKFNFSFRTSVRNFSGWAGTFYRWPTYCLKGLVRERWREGEKERGRTQNCTREQTQDKEMLFFHEKCGHNNVP